MESNISTDLAQVLTQLKDIHYPPDALWWPPTLASTTTITGAAFLIFYLSYQLLKKIIQFYNKRTIIYALQKINEINLAQENTDPVKTVSDISLLLKRCAIAKYSKKNPQIKSLHGNQWLEFLNNSGKTDQFTKGPGQLIITIPYLNTVNYENYNNLELNDQITKLIQISKRWIRKNL